MVYNTGTNFYTSIVHNIGIKICDRQVQEIRISCKPLLLDGIWNNSWCMFLVYLNGGTSLSPLSSATLSLTILYNIPRLVSFLVKQGTECKK